MKYSSLALTAFDILAAVLSSGCGCASLQTEAWKDLNWSAEKGEGAWEARRRRGEKEGILGQQGWGERTGRGDNLMRSFQRCKISPQHFPINHEYIFFKWQCEGCHDINLSRANTRPAYPSFQAPSHQGVLLCQTVPPCLNLPSAWPRGADLNWEWSGVT